MHVTFDDSTRKRGSCGEGHVFIGKDLAEDRPLLAAFIAWAERLRLRKA